MICNIVFDWKLALSILPKSNLFLPQVIRPVLFLSYPVQEARVVSPCLLESSGENYCTFEQSGKTVNL